MDGFDDLLKQSRSALEDNPFEDPFAKPRSNSPDPWSSNYLGSSTAATDDFDSSSAFDTDTTTATSVVHDDERSTTPTTESQPFSGGADPAPAPADPLDLANANLSSDEDEPSKPSVKSPRSYGFRESVEPEHEPPSSSTSSGFRESIEPETEPESQQPQPKPQPQPQPLLSPLSAAADSPISPTPYSPIATNRRPSTPSTVSITSPVFAPGTSTSTSASDSEPASSPPVSARLPQRQTSRPSAMDTPHLGTPTPQTRSIISPLEQQQGSLDGSFANLALGGEGFSGGWDDGAQSTFMSSPPVQSRPEKEEDDDDDDDDKPLRPRPSESEPSNRLSASLSSKDKGIQPEFFITVDDPQKVGDPIRGYTMYTVHTRTTSPLFTKPSFSVLRRYSDFLWLYETLSLSNPGVVVPPVPEKNPFGRFDDRFVQQRRIALENCISKIANHPVLGKDPDLRFFLESDNFALDIKHRKAELAQEKGGLLANLGQSIAGPRFIENDEWFDRQKGYLDTLETQLRGLVKAIDVVSKQRTELSTAEGEFAQMIADLASSDLGKPLMASLGLLADVERKAQDIESEQAKQDLVTLMGTADEYARLINSVRMAFSSRIRTYHAWQTADTELRRARQNHDRNRAQGRIPTDRMGHSMSQIADAERRALESKNEFEHVSKLVKSEVARFETERIEDFKRSMERFLDGMIDRQKELIAAREQFQHAILQRVSSSSAGQQQTNGSSALRTVA